MKIIDIFFKSILMILGALFFGLVLIIAFIIAAIKDIFNFITLSFDKLMNKILGL